MVLVDHMGLKLRRRQWTGTTEQLIEELELTYGNDLKRFCSKPFTSLDVGLYALACEEDVRCLATLVRSFKLIEVYIEHGVTVLDFYLRAPRFRATLEDITDEPAVTTSQVIDDVMRQLSFDDRELDGEAGFADVVGSSVDSSELIETQSELLVSEEPDVGPTQKPILAEKEFVDMPSKAVEKRMDANVPDEIDGAKGEQVPNHIVKKGNLEFLVCKEVANPCVNELVDKGKPLKRKRVCAE
uniref:Uncharacterized protein n=1 Tax=Tanacetum cinerariifolium TaxID=118510 RepID=A0A6L2LRG2_TANCI|nr:hypothetical protein [Tanacetum cinerariifolium]